MFKHIKESNMFKTAVVFRDRADKFISRVLLPIGIFLAFSPNILEPSGLWRLIAICYFFGSLLLFLTVAMMSKQTIPKEDDAKKKRNKKIGAYIVRIAMLSLIIFITYFAGVALYKDTYGLLIKSEEPIVAVHTVKDANASLGGMWFVLTNITIEEKRTGGRIKLMFSPLSLIHISEPTRPY